MSAFSDEIDLRIAVEVEKRVAERVKTWKCAHVRRLEFRYDVDHLAMRDISAAAQEQIMWDEVARELAKRLVKENLFSAEALPPDGLRSWKQMRFTLKVVV